MRTRGTSSMLKAGKRLIAEWSEFVALFTLLVNQGLSPQLDFLTTQFTSLLAQLTEIAALIYTGSFDTLISPSFFEKIREDTIAMRKEANAARRLSPAARSAEFNQRDFGRKILALGESAAQIFGCSVPKVVMITAEVMRLRTNVKVICDDLFRMGSAMCLFEDTAATASFQIAETCREFNSVFRALNLPLEIQVTQDTAPPDGGVQDVRNCD
jgi:hypothetical protein